MPGDAFLFWAQVSDASTGLLALASEPQLCCLSGAPIQPKEAVVSLAPLCASLRAVYKRLVRDFAKSPPPGMCPDPQKCSRQCEDALRKWLADKTRNGLRAGGFFCRAFSGEVQLVLLGPCILRAKLPCSVKSNDRLLKILNLIREKLVRAIIVHCAFTSIVHLTPITPAPPPRGGGDTFLQVTSNGCNFERTFSGAIRVNPFVDFTPRSGVNYQKLILDVAWSDV